MNEGVPTTSGIVGDVTGGAAGGDVVAVGSGGLVVGAGARGGRGSSPPATPVVTGATSADGSSTGGLSSTPVPDGGPVSTALINSDPLAMSPASMEVSTGAGYSNSPRDDSAPAEVDVVVSSPVGGASGTSSPSPRGAATAAQKKKLRKRK
ncbi:hypothetical protein E2C01_083345 [Portunus trituberculatus]|uniref:Uncharacterized protein n=1 Tax=Portunus trituberculatus TaxID=210409 RepID=A0A5B7IWY7_PORTR|nr:hypothetical protein [Portunus trituberculatus]